MTVGQAHMLLPCAVTSKQHAKPGSHHTHQEEKNLLFHKSQSMGRRWGVGERAGIQSAGVSSGRVPGEKRTEDNLGELVYCVWERAADGTGRLSGGNWDMHEALERPKWSRRCEELEGGERRYQNKSARHWRWREKKIGLGQRRWQHFDRLTVLPYSLHWASSPVDLSRPLWLIDPTNTADPA